MKNLVLSVVILSFANLSNAQVHTKLQIEANDVLTCEVSSACKIENKKKKDCEFIDEFKSEITGKVSALSATLDTEKKLPHGLNVMLIYERDLVDGYFLEIRQEIKVGAKPKLLTVVGGMLPGAVKTTEKFISRRFHESFAVGSPFIKNDGLSTVSVECFVVRN